LGCIEKDYGPEAINWHSNDYAGYRMTAREASIFGHSIQRTGPDHGDAVQQSVAEPTEWANAPLPSQMNVSGHVLGRSSRFPSVLPRFDKAKSPEDAKAVDLTSTLNPSAKNSQQIPTARNDRDPSRIKVVSENKIKEVGWHSIRISIQSSNIHNIPCIIGENQYRVSARTKLSVRMF
jgi:hypothetical protein